MGRHPASWAQADRRADPVIEDALNKGLLDSGTPYSIAGFESHDAANEGRKAVNRSARRQNISPACWVADSDGGYCYKNCKNADAPHSVHFRLWSKNAARTHVFQESGGDPANLKFNPWAQGRKKKRDDDGNLT